MVLLGLDTQEKWVVFMFYVVIGCLMRVAMYGSMRSGSAPEYNQNSVLAVVTLLKLILASSLYLMQDGDLHQLKRQIRASTGLLLRYSLPAFTYLIYDTVAFINLGNTDPVTYNILLQLRTVVTGLVWQVFFKQLLTRNQWIAIVLLTCSCIVQNLGAILEHASSSTKAPSNWSLTAVGLIGLQIAANVFSGVFTELLLKEKGSIGVNLQNIYMYSWTIVLNTIWLGICPVGYMCKSSLVTALSLDSLAKLINPWIILFSTKQDGLSGRRLVQISVVLMMVVVLVVARSAGGPEKIFRTPSQ